MVTIYQREGPKSLQEKQQPNRDIISEFRTPKRASTEGKTSCHVAHEWWSRYLWDPFEKIGKGVLVYMVGIPVPIMYLLFFLPRPIQSLYI